MLILCYASECYVWSDIFLSSLDTLKNVMTCSKRQTTNGDCQKLWNREPLLHLKWCERKWNSPPRNRTPHVSRSQKRWINREGKWGEEGYIFRNEKHLALQAAHTIWVWEIWIDVEDSYLNRHVARQEWQWRRGWWTWRWRRWSHTNRCLPFRSHFPCFLASSPPYTNERTKNKTPKYKPRRLLRLRYLVVSILISFVLTPGASNL